MGHRRNTLPALTAAALVFGLVYAATPTGGGNAPRDEENDAPVAGAPSAAPQPDVHYGGCDEARRAGAAPIHRGQPGYRPEMDGDSDGIACEPHRRW